LKSEKAIAIVVQLGEKDVLAGGRKRNGRGGGLGEWRAAKTNLTERDMSKKKVGWTLTGRRT